MDFTVLPRAQVDDPRVLTAHGVQLPFDQVGDQGIVGLSSGIGPY